MKVNRAVLGPGQLLSSFDIRHSFVIWILSFVIAKPQAVSTCVRSLSRHCCSQKLYCGSPRQKVKTASGSWGPSRAAEGTRTNNAPS
jgi:hypothetical protein